MNNRSRRSAFLRPDGMDAEFADAAAQVLADGTLFAILAAVVRVRMGWSASSVSVRWRLLLPIGNSSCYPQ